MLQGPNVLNTVYAVVLAICFILGLVVSWDLINSRIHNLRLNGYLWLSFAAAAVGFLLPRNVGNPVQVVGFLSVIAISIAFLSIQRKQLDGKWRKIFVIMCVMTMYFQAFVLSLEAFTKIMFLRELAPTASALPFKLAELIIFAFYFKLGMTCLRLFKVNQKTTT